MLSRKPDLPAVSAPTLGDLDYRVQGLLPTDSKMSEILLATDAKGQRVIFKIACVQQRARAETNRRAIHNSVAWLQQVHSHPGIAQMQPIRRKGQSGLRAWFTPPTFVATLPDWPDNPDFMLMEYLAGGTLSSFVGKRPLPVDLALAIAHDLAQTLAYLHAHQCVHRDLKPENILFRAPPAQTAKPGELQPVLIDFGVAAPIGEPKLICGSRLWMAPELQDAYEKSLLPVDPTWDVYGLGLICCYMLSGIRPRRRQYDYQDYLDYREQVFALLQQEAADADPAWQQVVAALQQLLTRTLDLDPRHRPTAAAFADALAMLLVRMGVALPKRDKQTAGLGQWRHALEQRVGQVQAHWRWIGLAILTIIGLTLATPMMEGQTTTARGVMHQSTMVELAVLPSSAVSQPTNTTSTALPTTSLPAGGEVNRAGAETTQQSTTGLPSPTAPTPTSPPPAQPPPTLAALPGESTRAIPTLALNRAQLTPPPTLVQFTPTLRPTATPSPTPPLPTGTATPLPPTPTQPLPTATAQPQPTAVRFAAIRLVKPAAGVTAGQARVEFTWEPVGAALAPDHCYELVFWDPAKNHDKRSPIGAGKTPNGTVNFSKLRESPDPLLRTLAGTPKGFDWGVRLVSCASPQTILQDSSEARHYTYQP